MTSINELATGSKSWKWDDNPEIDGTVVAAEQRQQTEFDSGKPLTWDDGSPRMQWVFTLQVAEPTSDDDGLRCIYAKGGNFEVGEGQGKAMQPAIFDAYRAAGVTEIEGVRLRVKRTGLGKASRGKQAPPLYSAMVEKASTPVPASTGNPFT